MFDGASRRAIRSLLVRASIYMAFSAGPWLLGLQTSREAGTRLVAIFALGGAFAMVLAVLRGEKAGKGPLNRWDDAMAFTGAALLTHLVCAHG